MSTRDATDTQLPTGEQLFLDHVGYFTADLAIAGLTLERLGFDVSAVNAQASLDPTGALVPAGTSNRLVRLRRGFLEVLAATADTPLADQLRMALGHHPGLHLIAVSHADIPAQRRRLTSQGWDMQPTVALRRPITTADGPAEVVWSVLRRPTTPTPPRMWPAGAPRAPTAGSHSGPRPTP